MFIGAGFGAVAGAVLGLVSSAALIARFNREKATSIKSFAQSTQSESAGDDAI